MKALEWVSSRPVAGLPVFRRHELNNQWFSKIADRLVIAQVLFTVFKQFDTRGAAGASMVGYSDFLEQVRN